MQQVIHTLNVTPEQIDKVRPIEHNGSTFYLVENSHGDLDDEGNVIEYRVSYDKGHKCWTCTCPAGNPPCDEHGYLAYAPRGCWHLRAVAVYEEEHREQSQIEAYVRQGVSREVAMRIVFAKPTRPSQAKVKRAMQTNQARPFSILR